MPPVGVVALAAGAVLTAPADRARNAGYTGAVAETVAINPALAISGIELINQWYHRPDYYATIAGCSNVQIGVWPESHFDLGHRDFGQVPGWTPYRLRNPAA